MRITLVSTRGDGLPALRFASLCNALADAGFRICALGPPSLAFLLSPQVQVVRWRGAGPKWNPQALLDLGLKLQGSHPDLVHACDDRAAWMVAQVAGRLGAWPCIASLSKAGPLARRFAKVWASSPLVADKLAAQLLFPAAPATEADAAGGQALRERLCVPYGAKVVWAHAAFDEPGLLEALPELWPRVGGAELWVSGSGQFAKHWLAKVRAEGLLIEGSYDRGGLVNGVRWFGSEQSMAVLLGAADAVLLPARVRNQTQPLADALLAGKPVLAVGQAWAGEILPAEYALPLAQEAQLGEVMSALVADVDLAKEAQAQAFARAQKEWTVNAVAEQVAAGYGEVLGRNPPFHAP